MNHPRPLRMLLATAAMLAATSAAGPLSADPFTSQRELLGPPARLTDEPPLPQLSDAEKGYLVRLARQALEHSARTGERLVPRDVPASLATKDYVAYVSCRLAGRLIDSVGGEGENLAENVTRAARHVASNKLFGAGEAAALSEAERQLAGVRKGVLELEILGPGQSLRWNVLDDVASMVSPGVHGLAVRMSGRTLAFKGSVSPTHGYSSERVVYRLIDKAGWTATQVVGNRDKVIFYRFRSAHLLERPAPPGYIELFRGSVLVAPESVTRQRLDELIDLTGPYMRYRQLNSGLFSYSYSPPQNRYVASDNPTRQAGAAWAMSRLAQATGEPAYEVAALRAIKAARIRYLDDDKKAACVNYGPDGGKEGLGTTALILLAVVDLPNNKGLAELRDCLTEGILRQQRPDGSLKVYYDDREDSGNRFYFPGEALLALMKVYGQTRQERPLAAVEKAFDFYRKMFEGEPNQSFIPWQSQAWGLAFDATGKKPYAEFVFQMNDWQASFQARATNAPYPDLVGGFVNASAVAGIGSAAYLEGMVEACRLARKLDDQARLARYGESLRLGARFLDQLTFKADDAYYCVSPRDAVGGVKFSVYSHAIRIDNCQHAALALIGIRDQLFGAAARPR